MGLERLNQVIRPATLQDSANLTEFLTGTIKLHKHLDWRLPLDWLGSNPFFIRLDKGLVEALLACPVEVDGVFWVRLFAASDTLDPADAWLTLFPSVLEYVKRHENVQFMAALPYQAWFLEILMKCGWKKTNEIIQLKVTSANSQNRKSPHVLRKMTAHDLDAVLEIDSHCFEPLWKHNRQGLTLAFQQASYATVLLVAGKIAGYQISTGNQGHIHIARLAVNPDYRRQGIGADLVTDVIQRAQSLAFHEITVNTQADNKASISLYQNCGFRRTGEDFPLFQYFQN